MTPLKHRLILVTLIGQMTTSLPGANVPQYQTKNEQLTIRSAVKRDHEWERQFPVLTRKLERWLDGLEGSKRIGLGGGHLSASQIARERNQYRLDRLESFFGKSPFPEQVFSQLLTEFWEDWRAWPTEKGATYFRGKRAEAYKLLQVGDTSRALRAMREAIAEIPGGFPIEFDLKLGDRFMRLWRSEVKSVRPSCHLTVSYDPKGVSAYLNGFLLGETQEVFARSGLHELRVTKAGYLDSIASVDCRTQGQRTIKIVLDRNPKIETEQTGPATVVWVDKDSTSDRVHLFLHTPGVALDEVPINSGGRLSDLLTVPPTSFPVTAEVFVGLLEQHRVASSALFSPVRQDLPLAAQAASQESVSWYQDWRVWAVVGTLAASATAVALLNNSSVGTSHSH